MSFDPKSLVGQTIGEYKLSAWTGRTKTTLRYKAHHQQLRRGATFHLLDPAADPTHKEAFLQKARRVSQIRHRALLDIFDSGHVAQSPYFISEELTGEPLSVWLSHHRLRYRYLRTIAEQLGQALVALVSSDLLVLGISPDDVFVGKTGNTMRVKFVGFHDEVGLPGGATATTRHPTLVAAARFLFGLCQVTPFSVRPPEKLTPEQPLWEPRNRLVGVSSSVENLLRRALDGLSAEQPLSVVQFFDELAEAFAQQGPQTNYVSAVRRPNGLAVAGLGVFSLLLLAGIVWFLGRRGPPKPQPTGEKELSVVEIHALAKKTLETGLRHSDPLVREQALLALQYSSDVGWQNHVEPLLDDAVLAVQVRAAEVLGSLGSRRALPILQTHLRDEFDPALQVAVARAVRNLGETAPQAVLARLLAGGKQSTQRAAAQLLAEKGDAEALRFLADLQRKEGDEALAANLWAARRSDAMAIDKLREHLPKKPPLEPKDIPVAALFLQQDLQTAKDLLAATATQPGPGQLLAAQVLCEQDDLSFHDLFVRVLEDPKRTVQDKSQAALGLFRCSDRRDVRWLLPFLVQPQTPDSLRQLYAGVLLRLTSLDPELLSVQGVTWAQQALKDDNWSVRQSAVALLGESVKPPVGTVQNRRPTGLSKESQQRVVQLLQQALEDKALPVRLTAIQAAQKLSRSLNDTVGAEKLKQQLRRRASVGMAEEKVVAAAALLRLGETAFRDVLLGGLKASDVAVRRVALSEASADPKLPTKQLVDLLTDPDLTVRFQAAALLFARGQRSPKIVKILKEALQHGGSIGVRAHSLLKTISVLKDEDQQPDLETLLVSADVLERLYAVDQLERLPAEEAGPLLLKATRDPHATVRFRLVDVVEKHCDQGDVFRRAAWPALRALAEDPDVAVRARAFAVFAKFQNEERTAVQVVAKPAQSKPRSSDETTGNLSETAMLSAEAAKANQAVDQQFSGGAALFKQGNYRAAQKALEKTSQLCSNRVLPKCAQINSNLAYQLGSTYENLGQLASAMSEYQKVMQSKNTGKRPPPRVLYDAALAGAERMRGKLGRLVLYKTIARKCQRVEVYMPPGKHQVNVGGGQRKAVELDAGESVELRTCK